MYARAKDTYQVARRLFRRHGGILRTTQALKLGIHPRTLYAMRDNGILEPLARGVYRLSELPPFINPDLVPIAVKMPDAVICLVSALLFHEITTQISHEIYIAIKRGSRQPQSAHAPIRVFRFADKAFAAGVETHKIDSVTVKVYNPAKTVADCFKYRNKIGLDVALEALRECWRARKCTMDELWQYAGICRVRNVMRPYLESLAQ